jgi:hypothetical protein
LLFYCQPSWPAGPTQVSRQGFSADRFASLDSARPVVRQREHGWFTGFDPAPIHKRTAISDRPVLLWTPFSEAVDAIKLERHHIAWRGVDPRHAGCRIVEAAHEVDSRIHVSAVELWEPECLAEEIVERRPVANLRRIDPYDYVRTVIARELRLPEDQVPGNRHDGPSSRHAAAAEKRRVGPRQPATDVTLMILLPALFLGAGPVACYVPARRAARIDPNVALRNLETRSRREGVARDGGGWRRWATHAVLHGEVLCRV